MGICSAFVSLVLINVKTRYRVNSTQKVLKSWIQRFPGRGGSARTAGRMRNKTSFTCKGGGERGVPLSGTLES